MLNVKTSKLSEHDLVSAVKDIRNRKKKESFLALLKSVAESANWDIDMILTESIQLIRKSEGVLSAHDAKVLQNDFRKVLIAKKYGISEKYDGWTNYWVARASDDCIVIQAEDTNTSIILNSDGNLILDEGKVRLNSRSLTSNGYNAINKGGSGLFSRKGKEILPCVFIDVENHLDGRLLAVYKSDLHNCCVEYHCYVREDSEAPRMCGGKACFLFDGGIVEFGLPHIVTDREYNAKGMDDIFMDKEQRRVRREQAKDLISKVNEELFAIIGSTHQRMG